MDSRQRGRDIEDILTPKHLPECNVYFGDNKKKKNGIWAKLVRITAIAASLAAVTFIISKVDFISPTHAAISPMEIMIRGLEKLVNQKSMRIEFKTCDKIKIGLPVKNDNEPATCKLYFLKKDSVIYMREEWNDEYNSVAIYDKDSLRLWQNGKLQKTLEIPFHPARYEILFDWFANIFSKFSGIVDEHKSGSSNASVEDFKSVQISKDGKTITIETQPQNSQFYILVFSTERNELINIKLVKEDKDSSVIEILSEYSNIVYDYPTTLEEMMKAPCLR